MPAKPFHLGWFQTFQANEWKTPYTLSEGVPFTGYSLGTPTLSIIDHQYETNFGDIRVPPDGVPFSCIAIDLPVKRIVLPHIVKLFVPIFIVILITALIFVLPARLEEARAGIGITALLTIIALQWSTEGDLPSVEYLTMLDVIYILSMIYIVAATGYSVLASRRGLHEKPTAVTATSTAGSA
ncbi:hypothetical protein AB4Z39_00080 [Mycobacterium adipatum]|uniref:hypothetical protein n=1 Tax=Mycobacterium adipatum TaxID=1682113 RepID=UPI0034E06226